MQVKEVTAEDLASTYCCMSETPPGVSWTDFVPDSRRWFKANLGKTVEGYHLLDGDKVVGHIYYGVSENALIPYEIESKVACIYCTEMLRSHAHKGFGKMMFDYMKNDLKKKGFRGILVDATDIKEFMHYELFLKQGFKIVKEHAPFKLMYFPLTKEAVEFKLIELNYKPSTEKVEVTLSNSFFCPVGVHMYHRIKKVAESFGSKVKIIEIDTTPETVRKYGTAEPLINGKIRLFGPASEDDVKKAIQEEIDHFKR